MARHLAAEAMAAGQPLSWFETLYLQAAGNASLIPWADLCPNPNLVAWLDVRKPDTESRRALVVGCGLGDDVEALASIGFNVTGFDIASTCIDWCKRRFPQSTATYMVADLLNPPAPWHHGFDFVFEAYTLQALPPVLRQAAIERIADLVAADGALLVITRGRDARDDSGSMPWPLLRTDLDRFAIHGLTEVEFEDYIEPETPPVRRFRVEYKRVLGKPRDPRYFSRSLQG